MGWAARWCPFFTESLLVLGYTVLFFAASPQQRRAIRGNLRVLKPEWGAVRRFFASFAVFWEFACTIADAVRAREDAGLFAWSLEGAWHFEKLAATARGSLILTAHMGNYDVAAPFFATQLGGPFTSVRLPERRPELQAYMDEIRARQETANFHIRYNRPGEFLAVDLAHALAAGEIIGLQGDRAPVRSRPCMACSMATNGRSTPSARARNGRQGARSAFGRAHGVAAVSHHHAASVGAGSGKNRPWRQGRGLFRSAGLVEWRAQRLHRHPLVEMAHLHRRSAGRRPMRRLPRSPSNPSPPQPRKTAPRPPTATSIFPRPAPAPLCSAGSTC